MLQWFGTDANLLSPHYGEQFRVQNTRLGTLPSPTTPVFTVSRGLLAATKGPVPRLPQRWGRRCKLTIPATVVVGRHAALRVLITHANLPTEVLDSADANRCAANGGDIRFSLDVDGMRELPCEVVTITQDANPANTRAEIWVLVPGVSSTADTEFYVWWKGLDVDDLIDASTPAMASKFETWDFWSDYRTGVHGPHPSAAAPKSIRPDTTPPLVFKPVTGVNLAAAADQWGGMGAFNFAAGAVDRRIYISESDVPEGTHFSANGFVSMWFRVTGGSTDRYLFSLGSSLTADRNCYALLNSSNRVRFVIEGLVNETAIEAFPAIADTNWHHLVCTWIGGEKDGVMEMYIDGGAWFYSSAIFQGPIKPHYDGTFYIGTPSASTTLHWVGDIDEPRYGTFPYPNGLAATEWFMQKGANVSKVVVASAPTTPSLPAQPYTLNSQQYLMIGPKNNGDMQTRYRSKFTPIATVKLDVDIVSVQTVYNPANDPQGNYAILYKYTPVTTKKGFVIFRRDSLSWYSSPGPATFANCGKDPSFSTFLEYPREKALHGYSRYANYDTYAESSYGICFVSQEAAAPLYFWAKLPATPDADTPLGFFWVNMPAASSVGSPNAIPLTLDPYPSPWSNYTEYLDECESNGSGDSKSLYLKFTSVHADTYYLSIWGAYGEVFTVVYYGTDSTFTTPVSTFSDITELLNEAIAVLPAEVHYVKVLPSRPASRTIIQAQVTTPS